MLKESEELKTYLGDTDGGNVNPVKLWDATKAVPCYYHLNYIRTVSHKKSHNAKTAKIIQTTNEVKFKDYNYLITGHSNMK